MKFGYSRLLCLVLTTVLLISQLPLVSSVEAASGSVTVTKVVNPTQITEGEEAEIQLDVIGSPDVTVIKPNDIILIIDRSGSMAADYGPNNGEDKMKNAKNAAKGFIDLVDFTKHRVGIVDFASDEKSFDLSDNPTELKNYIDKITAGGGTGTRDAIALAQELLRNHRAEAQPVIVLMTDGQATEPSPDSYARQVALEQANSAKGEGVVFYTIALLLPNENPDTSAPNLLLKDMATTAHHHHFVLGSVGLAEIYAAIVDEIGLASAYNVKVTDTVAPEFEIVPNSYQDNIPQPIVNGNTLTWTFNELKKDALSFKYKIRHKLGSNTGLISVGAEDIHVKYDDYLGVPHEYDVRNPKIEVKYKAPIITSIVKDSGPFEGGESVVITGENFRPNVKVKFGKNFAPSVQFNSSTELIVTTPAGVPGTVEVTVINDDGQTATGAYNYYAVPVISKVTPNEGPLAGNNEVTIQGNYFLTGAQVKMGEKTADVISITPTKIVVKAPATSIPETVAVEVTNSDGLSAKLDAAYSYILGPELVSVSPNEGLTTGGESVTLTGSRFKTGTKVYFNNKVVPSTYVNDTTITILTPSWSKAEAVTVKIVNPDGQFIEQAEGYTYKWPKPEITSIQPNEGFTTGDTLVTLNGSNFLSGAKVYFNDTLVTQTTFYSGSVIKIRTPKWSNAESVNIKIENPDGQTALVEKGYNYILPPPPPAPIISSVSPDHGLITGGTEVLVNGSNFINGAKVKLKDQEIATTFVSSTQLKITTPVWASAEIVDVTVTNPDGQAVTKAQAFSFETPPPPPAPEITSITPNEGKLDGGLVITITGANFDTTAKVYFNDTLIQYTVYSKTQIKAVTPKWVLPGAVDVKVINDDGQVALLEKGFNYLTPPAPVLSSISPTTGLVTGGTLVTVNGSNFVNGVKLTLGNQEIPVIFVSATQLKFTTPEWQTAETVDIRVTNPDGQTDDLPQAFTFETPPPPPPMELTNVSPNEGEMAGGLLVTLSGKNFDSGAKVYFNDTLVQSTFYSSSTIKLKTPKWSISGTVDVKVVNSDGQSSVISNGFNYLAPPPPPAPILTSVTPNTGLITGGKVVVVTGNNFVNGAKINVGGLEVATTFVSATQLKFTTPAWQSAETVDIRVTNPDGQTAVLPQAFTFETPPPPPPVKLTSISPNEGEMAGGLLITLVGENFDTAAKVYFNDTQVQATVYSSGQIKARTPVWTTSGPVDVKVVNGDGQSSTLSGGFNYLAPPPPPPLELTSVSPSEGELTGGLLITLTGKNFVSGAKVYFNDVLLQSTTYSSTQIKANTPSWTQPGTVTIKVVNPNNESVELVNGFTYKEPPTPEVQSVTPNQGELTGGLVITLSGNNFDTGVKVYFNDSLVQATRYSSTQIKVSTPKWTVAGPVDIKVVNSTGKSVTVPSGFTYLAPPPLPSPVITSLSPTEGPLTGGTLITITGQNFVTGAQVYFNDTLIQSTVYSKSQIKARTPRWTVAEPVNIRVVNPDGQSSEVIINGYTYK
ncbi:MULTISPECIES: IPT/TIG domain-containing protein [Paenibacillus]|uniref:IPT/TIG domain-containing protein n=1 Tax=Paenibacillus TaxID=44249 RepID=UPI0004B9314E|nr:MULTISPECIES: IPT/TIG domain-containing protein [Paenibacillus]